MVWLTDEECWAENALRAPTSMWGTAGWKLWGAVHRALACETGVGQRKDGA